MGDNTVNIAVKTVADLSGATAAAGAIRGITMETARLEKANDKARVDEWGFYRLHNLPEKVRRVTKEIHELAPASEKAGTSSRKFGFLASQAGVQLGDFATQVSMGTSAARAFSMQAPQVIGQLATAGVMGTKMALAMTGIGAAIPLALMAAPALMSFLSGTSEKAEDAAEKIDGLGEKLAKIQTERSEKVLQNLQDAEDRSRALDISTATVRTAQEAAAKSQLENAAKLAQAEQNVNVILGIRVDQFKQIREENERAAKVRQQELDAANQAAAEEAAEMQREIDRLAATMAGTEAELAELRRRKDEEETLIAGLEGKRSEYQSVIKGTPAINGGFSLAPQNAWAAWDRQKEVDQARNDLKGVDKMISERGESLGAVELLIKKAELQITKGNTAIEAKSKELAAKAEAAQINLVALAESQGADTTLELTETVRKNQAATTATLTTLRDDLQKASDEQGGLSMSAARALFLLNQTLANNQVDPNEVGMVREAVAQLLASNEAVRGAVLGGFTRLTQENLTLRSQIDALQKQFDDVKKLTK